MRREFAEQKRRFEETVRDPEQAAAFKAAVKAYQEQFNCTAQVQIHNGRDLADAGLDTTGFALVRHESAVTDWSDDEQVQAVHYDELRALVAGLTGASRCFVNRHTIRKSDGSTKFTPFMEVHSDFTDRYKQALLKSLELGQEITPTFGVLEQLQAEGVTFDDLREARLLVVHAWRSVSKEPHQRFPLALCDGRTVDEQGLIRETVSGLERYRTTHSAGHKWYWFPEMRADEVLLFKGYDSECPRYAFHSAFEHEGAPPDAGARFSCEMRVICLVPPFRQ